MQFTKEQSEAVAAHGRSVCVSAGAGSGKTAVLVHRFIDEVTRFNVPVDRILAITFTNKAAFEMKSRIADELRKQSFAKELRELEGAYISTIDSFCARVLRENPVEAGIDPQFRVVDENEKLIAVSDIVDETLDLLSSDDLFKSFLYRYGVGPVETAIKAVFEKLRISSPDQSDETQTVREKEGGHYYADVMGALEAIRSFKKGDGGKHKQRFEAADALITKLKQMGTAETITWEDYDEINSLSKDGKIKVPTATADLSLRAAIEAFRDHRDIYLDHLAEELGASDYSCFMKAVGKFRSRYEEWKRERRLLDFPDLLMKTLELFSSDTYFVRSFYQQKFRLIMLDEFQDTNPLQNKIVEQLSSADNIFVVGDEKQAIYGFRNADVELFEKRKTLLLKGTHRGSVLALNKNFRTRREIVGFINDLFEDIAEEDGGWPASERLEPDPGLQNKFPVMEGPFVEWIVSRTRDEDGEEETKKIGRFKEAKMLARRLHRLVEEEKRPIYNKKVNAVRNCRYQDIAILLRARTALPVIERALKEEAVPYFVVSGNGFYYQTEIRDLISFLTILENPTYDIPLAGVLRSPFVGCSDDALLWLGQYTKRDRDRDKACPLINAVEDFERIRALSEDDQRRIAKFLEQYRMLLDEKLSLRTSEFIHRIIQLTRYDAMILGDWGGKRKVANLRKLIDLSEKFEEGEIYGTRAFIRHLKELHIREVEESEAQVESEDDDVVRIITIHKAKGLEFPVVALADLGYQDSGKTDSFAVVDRNGKVSMKVINGSTGVFVETLSFKKFKAENDRRERAESKRLFYVGATRARDLLILSGVAKTGGQFAKKSYGEMKIWMEWLRKAFQDQRDNKGDKADVLDYKGHQVKVWSEHAERSAAQPDRQTFLADSDAVRALFEGRDSAEIHPSYSSGHDVGDEVRRIVEQTELKVRPFYETVDVAATSLLTYEMCPQLFYYRHVLGWPELNRVYEIYDHERRDAEDALISRTDLGNIVHGILEKTSFGQRFQSEVNQSLETLRMRASKDTVQKVKQILDGLMNSSVFAELSSARNLIKEFKFALKLRHGIVNGAIDLLYENNKGEVIIADYKTADINENEMPAQVEKYRTQLFVYALAVNELKRQASKTVKLIFLNERFTGAIDLPVTPAELKEEELRIARILEKIAQQNFKPNQYAPCMFCVSKETCLTVASSECISK